MQIKINKQQEQVIKDALNLYIDNLVGRGNKYNYAIEILNSINSAGLVPETTRIPKVLLAKEYMFGFEGGGWNSVWAKTKRGAIRAAQLEYKESNLVPNRSSFRLATEQDLKSAMSLFY
jgi:hypothetical protein